MNQLFPFFSTLLLVAGLNAQQIDLSHFDGIKARNIGPAGMSGRVTAIDVNLSNEEQIYVGTASGGVWYSSNGGVTWEPIFDKNDVLSIGALKINQSNPSEIWVGTGEGNPRNSQNSGGGVYRSLDGGKTWSLMGLEKTKVIHRILIDAQSPGTVYVGAQGSAWGPHAERGVYKTTDGGATWTKSLYVNEQTGIGELIMDPTNPKKLIAAMWEFGRKPWTFNSGGAGSGLYITHDGGVHWTRIEQKEAGLPTGDLGRIGLAIAPSAPHIVYALVEAKENALYKSMDGGSKWAKVSTDPNIGNRPFYYAEIYVDPTNELRLYSLWSYISMSEDGGKTFKVIADYGNDVHPDHHALWIHPTRSNYLINGNDGGMNISYDRGKTWRFVANLPVGQFYHVNVDDEFPYQVYGGMQDNGSWVGPGFTLKSGDITNHDWQEVFFGDGFDVVAKPDNTRYLYAMSQGGNLGMVDKVTGQTKFIRPNHPDSVRLRYNWNAPLALAPDSECGLYYGSQFVHYSADCGQSWTIISPDLTTNDTSKQHQDVSGGLTIDATNAENNTTLLSITPSPVDPQVVWTGSDDGRLHITRDGGESWTDVYSRLPGAPRYGWIPQIRVGSEKAGEAFVVVNNYRMNDWSAYAYHTIDYGQTWSRIVDDGDVSSFTTSIIQDVEEPNLVFLGTDSGLYISVDKGRSWNKWDNEFPSVQIRDMALQSTFGDLVLGTFGRAFWVIDDIGPFRELARSAYIKKPFDVVSVSPAYLSERRSYQGIRFVGQAEFVGDNKNTNAHFSIWINPDADTDQEEKQETKEPTGKAESKAEKNKLHYAIVDMSGDTIRRFSRDVKEKGLIRQSWNLETDGTRGPSRTKPKEDADLPRGLDALPGKYMAYVSYGGSVDSIEVEVMADPRLDITETEREEMIATRDEYDKLLMDAKEAYDQIVDAKESLGLIEKMSDMLSDTIKTQMKEAIKTEKKQLDELDKLFFNPQKQKGIQRNPENLMAYIGRARRYIGTSIGRPGPNAAIAMSQAQEKCKSVADQVEAYMTDEWASFQSMVEGTDFPLFKKE